MNWPGARSTGITFIGARRRGRLSMVATMLRMIRMEELHQRFIADQPGQGIEHETVAVGQRRQWCRRSLDHLTHLRLGCWRRRGRRGLHLYRRRFRRAGLPEEISGETAKNDNCRCNRDPDILFHGSAS
jgi:hypothetical protein